MKKLILLSVLLSSPALAVDGVFVNLSASGVVSGTGFSDYMNSPPPIGNTVANTGKFTTLSGGSGAVSFNATGTFTQTPTTSFASGVIPGIQQNIIGSGSFGTASGVNLNQFSLTSDNISVSGAPSAAILNQFTVQDTAFGGTSATGGRVIGAFLFTQSSASESTHTFRSYIGVQGGATTTSGDGGGAGTEKGDYYGFWGTVSLGALATHVTSLTSAELDINAASGSSVLHKSGLLITHANLYGHGNDTAVGSVHDANIWMINNTGSVGATVGILFGRTDGFGGLGVNSTGTLLATANEVATIGSGIDLTGGGNTTITNFAWKSKGASIDGNGNGILNTLGLTLGGSVFWGTNTGTSGGMVAIATSTTGMFLDNRQGGDTIFRFGSGPTEKFRIAASGVVKPVSLTVATLPTCNTGLEGSESFVTDANTAPVYNNVIPVGGGVNRGHVLCRNSAWVWD